MSWSSGTNTIKEGDESKSLTLQMLEVKKQGGGTELFVRKSDVTLGTKSVNQNGTYTAAADGKYGFSQFSVNVRGGNGSADSHGKPTGGDIKPGGAGSAVVGTDPETGNDVVVGVDEDDNLVKTPLPSSIVLVTPPTKTDYNDGESIDLSGAVVVAKMADGTTWTDVDHPNGHVSCTPEPAAADIDGVTEHSAGSGATGISTEPFPDPFNWTMGSEFRIGPESGKCTLSRSLPITSFFKQDESGCEGVIVAASESPFTVTNGSAIPITRNGKTVYTTWRSGGTVIEEGYVFEPRCNEGDYHGISTSEACNVAWIMVYGAVSGGTQTITLNWARPGDGKVLSTTMEINVGAHSTESSSGTGGSGGGGSF